MRERRKGIFYVGHTNKLPKNRQGAARQFPVCHPNRRAAPPPFAQQVSELQGAIPGGGRTRASMRLADELSHKRPSYLLMCINVVTPFSLRDSNQRTACALLVRVSPHVCCQVYKVQVSVSNIVADATGSRHHTTSNHKYPPSVSCHVPRCSIPSQHISPMMRPNELPQNPISINTPLGDDDCNVFRLSGMSSYR